jgi:hypothetical protein
MRARSAEAVETVHGPDGSGASEHVLRANLTVLSLLLAGEHTAAADRLGSGKPDPADFIRFVQQHWLELVITALLQGSPARAQLPAQWLAQLKAASVRQWAVQERLVRELLRLSQILEKGGQRFILLKGPYLAAHFFGGIERRAFSDLDVLIPRSDVARVEQLLCAGGYRVRSSRFLGLRLTTHFAHSFDFTKPDLALDVHWKFAAQPHRLDYETIWRDTKPFAFRGRRFLVLSDEYEIVFNLISTFKDLEMGITRLRSFVDLHAILGKIGDGLDWETFLGRRQAEGILKIVIAMLDFFFALFPCRDRFPRLGEAIACKRARVAAPALGDFPALLQAAPGALGSKIWASAFYECARWRVFSWWALSYPFRLAVYQPPKYVEFKQRISQFGRALPMHAGRKRGEPGSD